MSLSPLSEAPGRPPPTLCASVPNSCSFLPFVGPDPGCVTWGKSLSVSEAQLLTLCKHQVSAEHIPYTINWDNVCKVPAATGDQFGTYCPLPAPGSSGHLRHSYSEEQDPMGLGQMNSMTTLTAEPL
jgi:hypothetical protein